MDFFRGLWRYQTDGDGTDSHERISVHRAKHLYVTLADNQRVRNLINIIRWTSVIPASYLGYHIALIGGMAAHSFAESFCPPEAVISGMCTANYMRPIETFLFLLFPGIAAILVVLLPALAAPSKKITVPMIFFALGASAAIYMGTSLGEWIILFFALVCGAATVLFIYVNQNKQTQNT